jgi:restriction system protein
MAIPDFQTILRPFLEALTDGEEVHMNTVIDKLADHFELTAEERSEKYKSGNDYVFSNRIRFARVHLKSAGLIDAPRRGYIQITNEGKNFLKSSPERITLRQLATIPAYAEFRERIREGGSQEQAVDEKIESAETPLELIEAGYQRMKTTLASELKEAVQKASPAFFENLIVELLLKMGYGGSRQDAGRAVGQSGDGGIDGIINEDRLGLDVIYLQAKRWQNTVGAPDIQSFIGALAGKNAHKGVFVTTTHSQLP